MTTPHLGNLGAVYRRLGDLERAAACHQQALEISRELGDKGSEGQDLGNLGNVYVDLGHVDCGINHYFQYLSLARSIGDRRGEGIALYNIGDTYLDLGEFKKAHDFLTQALAIRREIGDRRGEANASWRLGLGLAAQGRYVAAAHALKLPIGYQYKVKHAAIQTQAADFMRMCWGMVRRRVPGLYKPDITAKSRV